MRILISFTRWLHSKFFSTHCCIFLAIVSITPSCIYAQRQVHIAEFGAVGNGITNNTAAFQKASKFLQEHGGVLVIDSGVYIVGRQRLSGSYLAGASYFTEPVFQFKDAQKPIEIIGRRAVLKAVAGLKYGSFNPVTGKKDSIRKEGNNSSYYASGVAFITAVGCASIKVSGLELDGNSSSMDIGPAFGPEGIQISALGISLFNNRYAEIADCYIHHCALDAIIVAWTGLKETDPLYPHIIRNVKAVYNGRQGISWVGGNSLTVTNSEFSSTGKTLNRGKYVVSQPAAGIDIEIENSIIKNGTFRNCIIADNTGPGLSTIAHATKNVKFEKCTFIGTTNSAAYPKSEQMSFDSCTFIGKVERIYGSTDLSKVISFSHCKFTFDTSLSPNGQVFGDHCEFYEGRNVVFKHCLFDAGKRALPVFNQQELTFEDCSFLQNSSHNFFASATFTGVNKIEIRGGGKLDAREMILRGKLIYNKQQITNPRQLR